MHFPFLAVSSMQLKHCGIEFKTRMLNTSNRVLGTCILHRCGIEFRNLHFLSTSQRIKRQAAHPQPFMKVVFLRAEVKKKYKNDSPCPWLRAQNVYEEDNEVMYLHTHHSILCKISVCQIPSACISQKESQRYDVPDEMSPKKSRSRTSW